MVWQGFFDGNLPLGGTHNGCLGYQALGFSHWCENGKNHILGPLGWAVYAIQGHLLRFGTKEGPKICRKKHRENLRRNFAWMSREGDDDLKPQLWGGVRSSDRHFGCKTPG